MGGIYERKWENFEIMSREPSLYVLLKRSNKFKEAEINKFNFIEWHNYYHLNGMNNDEKNHICPKLLRIWK